MIKGTMCSLLPHTMVGEDDSTDTPCTVRQLMVSKAPLVIWDHANTHPAQTPPKKEHT